MSEKEAIEVIKNIDFNYSRCKKCVLDNEIPCIRDGMNCQLIAINTVLQLLEQKDKRIDDLEKALVDEAIKSTEKINKLKYKLIGDKMEQFDDYIIYLIESYLEILEE